MRLFFSINLTEATLAAVCAVQSDLRDKVGDVGMKWSNPNQFHFTLKFVGESKPSDLGRLADIANMVCEDLSPFDLKLSSLGGFPNDDRPDVFWLGAGDGQDPLISMGNKLHSLLERYGVKGDKKPFQPHITLARVNGYQGEAEVAKILATRNRVGEILIHVDRFALMNSSLNTDGAEHKLLREFTF